MDNVEDVIAQLTKIDRPAYPYEDIKKLIGQFRQFGAIEMILHPGKVLVRARPNGEGERFNRRDQLSFKPQQHNKTYQRASTPNQTMFYAGTLPDDIKAEELDNARIIATLEASNLLRDTNMEGEQTITFTKWEVTKDIPLLAICYHKDFVERNSHTKELYEAYQNWAKQTLDENMHTKSMQITEFLASEFAKTDIKGDFDYMVSAIFTELAVKHGIAGVYYPSVRAEAMGYNVAISPEYSISSLKLVVAGECKMYKKGKHTIVDNETICLIDDDTKEFEFQPVAPQNHMGREEIMKRLNSAV